MEIYATEKASCFLFTINILTHINYFIHTFLRSPVYTTKWTQQARNSGIVCMHKNEIFKTTNILHKVYFMLFTYPQFH
jgi:hypothetical protein